MAFGVGVLGPMTASECKQNMHEHTSIMQAISKNPTSKFKIILFIANYNIFAIFRRFEQLSISIGWKVMAWGGLYPLRVQNFYQFLFFQP